MSAATGADEAAGVREENIRSAHKLIAGLFDLLNDDISGPQWNAILAHFARCETACCLWWPEGKPQFFQEELHGPRPELSADERIYLEAAVTAAQPTEPNLIQQWVAEVGATLPREGSEVLQPHRIIACVDWSPARVFLFLERSKDEPAWNDTDRQRVLEVLPVIHKSIAVKKKLSVNEDIHEFANKVFDEIPRGLIALTPESEILFADRVASALLTDGGIVQRSDKTLQLADKARQQQFVEALNTIKQSPLDAVNQFIWHARISPKGSDDKYLLVLKAYPHQSWRTESTPYDRMVLMVLQSATMTAPPEPGVIADLFGLTPAQAKVAAAVSQGKTAEQAARQLNISVNTVRSHLQAIYATLNVANKAQLINLLTSGLPLVAKDGP